ncbi:hypothetical protein V1294_001939 [Bradyrhizobium sp. AZCC 1678]
MAKSFPDSRILAGLGRLGSETTRTTPRGNAATWRPTQGHSLGLDYWV